MGLRFDCCETKKNPSSLSQKTNAFNATENMAQGTKENDLKKKKTLVKWKPCTQLSKVDKAVFDSFPIESKCYLMFTVVGITSRSSSAFYLLKKKIVYLPAVPTLPW